MIPMLCGLAAGLRQDKGRDAVQAFLPLAGTFYFVLES